MPAGRATARPPGTGRAESPAASASRRPTLGRALGCLAVWLRIACAPPPPPAAAPRTRPGPAAPPAPNGRRGRRRRPVALGAPAGPAAVGAARSEGPTVDARDGRRGGRPATRRATDQRHRSLAGWRVARTPGWSAGGHARAAARPRWSGGGLITGADPGLSRGVLLPCTARAAAPVVIHFGLEPRSASTRSGGTTSSRAASASPKNEWPHLLDPAVQRRATFLRATRSPGW